MMRVLLFGLLSVMLFSTCHVSLIPSASTTLRCQIPRFTSVYSRNSSPFRLLSVTVWVPPLQRTSSRSFNLLLISFVIQHRSAIPNAFSPMYLEAAVNRIALMRAYISSTFIFFVLALLRYLAFNFFGEGLKIDILTISD